jgi:hypothetical protein
MFATTSTDLDELEKQVKLAVAFDAPFVIMPYAMLSLLNRIRELESKSTIRIRRVEVVPFTIDDV